VAVPLQSIPLVITGAGIAALLPGSVVDTAH
jgi:hypothetical protein